AVLAGRDDRVLLGSSAGTPGLVSLECPGVAPAVLQREALDVGGGEIRVEVVGGDGRAGETARAGRVITVHVGGARFPRRGDCAHISHGPFLFRTLHGREQVRNGDGCEDADDRDDDQQLDEGETFLSLHSTLLFYWSEPPLIAIDIPQGLERLSHCK